MAVQEKVEQFSHAVIDTSDMTLTEFKSGNTNIYSIKEILERWNGVVDIDLTIKRRVELPPNGEGGT